MTDALRRINAERREKEAALAAMNRALADLNRERERSRKNIVARIQAEKKAVTLQQQVEFLESAASDTSRRFDAQVLEFKAQIATLESLTATLQSDKADALTKINNQQATIAALQVCASLPCATARRLWSSLPLRTSAQ